MAYCLPPDEQVRQNGNPEHGTGGLLTMIQIETGLICGLHLHEYANSAAFAALFVSSPRQEAGLHVAQGWPRFPAERRPVGFLQYNEGGRVGSRSQKTRKRTLALCRS